MERPIITIISRSYDGSVRKTWPAELLSNDGELLMAKGIFDIEIEHARLNVIRRGTISYEYFWTDRWYNVFRFHEPDGTFRNYYCNISMPPIVRGSVLDYVDLDIDIVVDGQGCRTILDEDEFRENAVRFGYPPKIHSMAARAVEELTGLIENRSFPFDYAEISQPNGTEHV